MALVKPEVSSENRGPGFAASQTKIIFTQDELFGFVYLPRISVLGV